MSRKTEVGAALSVEPGDPLSPLSPFCPFGPMSPMSPFLPGGPGDPVAPVEVIIVIKMSITMHAMHANYCMHTNLSSACFYCSSSVIIHTFISLLSLWPYVSHVTFLTL